jgi:integrase
MPKVAIPLTDTAIKALKPSTFRRDGGGLLIIVKSDGGKWWRFDYTRPNGGRNSISFGDYPNVTLQQARELGREAKSKLKQGIDIATERKETKQARAIESKNQFHLVVYEWISTIAKGDSANKRRIRALERDVFPCYCKYDNNRNIVSSVPMNEITTHHILYKALKEKESTGALESTQRILSDCKVFWRYAVRKEYTDVNITDKIDKSDFAQPDEKHYSKITDDKILGELLRAIDNYSGQKITRLAIRLVCLLPLRAGNLCSLKWSCVDFEKALITIPRQEMKVKDKNLPDFKIPLPWQATILLKEAHALTGWGEWVSHGISDFKTHLGNETINKALRTMGFNDEISGRKQTTHSFRGTFRSLTETHADKHKALFETREAVLDHQEHDKSKRAYTHKADYSEQMRPLLQWWADYLDEIKTTLPPK